MAHLRGPLVTHLWEVDHVYYCRQWRWNAEPCDDSPTRFKSFADFLSEEGDADLVMDIDMA